jgi:tetratricopeptide (TPR) repeat protein
VDAGEGAAMILPRPRVLPVLAVCLLLAAFLANSQEAKTVIGPANPDLAAGAEALLAGDAERGVALTLAGLKLETRARDRVAGLSNLCAGYIMLERHQTALEYCDLALEENERHWRAISNRALALVMLDRYEDAEEALQRAEAIAPNARNVQTVRAMLRDKTDPVAPSVIIDDRRHPDDSERSPDAH